MRIALFQRPDDRSFTMIYSDDKERWTDLVRVSDYIEVEFPPRTATAEVIAAQAKAIDEEIAKTEERHQKRMEALKASKTEVLSLAFKPDVAA